jgi:hypothetical protein
VDLQSENHKVLKISLDISLPVDAEVYQILNGFSSALERKNYLQSAILYYARSPLVLTSNALVDKLREIRVDEFSGVYRKLDEILEAIRSISAEADGVIRREGSVVSPSGEGSGLLLAEDTKSTLLSLKQQFKI